MADINEFATLNYNVYNHPYNTNPFVLEYIEETTPTYDLRYESLTFENWKARINQDLDSYGSFDLEKEYGEKILGENLIPNSTFDSGTDWWWDYGNDNFNYESVAYPSFEGKALFAKYSSFEFSASHIGISNFELEDGLDYLLSFSILGEGSGFIKFQFVSEKPYRPIITSDIPGCSFNTKKKENEIAFSVGKSTQVSLTFNSTSSDGNYYLDDVVLRSLSMIPSNTTTILY